MSVPVQFRDLVVELGFVTRAQLDDALARQDELNGSGVRSHLGHLLEDLGYLTPAQHRQVLVQLDMQRALAALPTVRRAPRHGWVVAALAPVALLSSPLAILAAAGVVLVGAWLAQGRPGRWLALGWAASVLVPGAGAATAAAAGQGGAGMRLGEYLLVALVIAVGAAAPLLPFALTPGHLFLIAALGLALLRRRPR